ncbi:type II secretion system protein [bacterium]|nr:type II secretion system protein [bacterium]
MWSCFTCKSLRLKKASGFSLLDLLVAISIIGIVGFLGIPQIQNISASFNRLNTRTVFIQDLKQAQAKALTEGCRGIFTFLEDNSGYSFGCDYLAYDSSYPPQADIISFSRSFPSGISVNPSQQIIFNSRGLPVDANDIINSVSVNFVDSSGGSVYAFASGTLFATGLFSFD